MFTLSLILVSVWIPLAIVAVSLSNKIASGNLIKNILTVLGSLGFFIALLLFGLSTICTVFASFSILGSVFSIWSLIRFKKQMSVK